MKRSIRNIFLLVAAFFLLSSADGIAQDIKKHKDRMAQLEKDISLLDAQITGIRNQSSSATEQLEILRRNISNRKSLVSESDKLIKTYTDSIRIKDNEIKELQAEVDTLLHYYGKLIRAAYKHRDPHVWYLYVFASDNIGQAFRRAGYFRNVSKQIREDAVVIRGKQDELQHQISALDNLKEEALEVRKARVEDLNKLRKDERDAENLVQQLKKDRKKIEGQIAAKKKEVDALNREIKKMISQAQKAGEKSSKNKAVDAHAVKLSADFQNNKGLLPWPVSGAVVGGFGKRYHPVYKNLELPPSAGIDMAVANGEIVNCIFDGTIQAVFVMPKYGQCVMVQHGPTYFTFYCMLGSISVKKGDKVSTGQQIGTVDIVNGISQFHFEIWEDKIPQNPVNWLRKK